MHKLALFFMLALTASASAALSEPVFAQEMADDVAEETSDEIVTSEETMGGEETTEEATGEETTDDSAVAMAETTMLETRINSPLKQMSMGVDVHQIQCSPEYKLVFKASNWNPACVKESSFQTLLAWGWISSHDPSHEELATMLADHMAKYPPIQDTETEQENEAQMEENMDVDDDTSSTNGTSTDQPEPQSHTINLSESMDMGAQ
jgi:hypothetical protein